MGGNYALWEDQVRRHVRWFSAEERPDVIMSLLSGQSYDRVSEEDVLKDENIGRGLRTVGHLLETSGHPIEYQKSLQRGQQMAELDILVLVGELETLANRGYPEGVEDIECRVPGFLVVRVSNHAMKKVLIGQNYNQLSEVVKCEEVEERRKYVTISNSSGN
ncbi:hypothetical protein FBUS_00370 [Fasciolopsis buskii]|uniref:Uncharacterized protein n=1 Tax=Fasciolopsis buskii TaxID=27845 RepID=A0A8E0S3B5_9TREM|nr:hypothetical protein FBUS_00370 [Fasciolopsis buski]